MISITLREGCLGACFTELAGFLFHARLQGFGVMKECAERGH
jgi:hypothetical protein